MAYILCGCPLCRAASEFGPSPRDLVFAPVATHDAGAPNQLSSTPTSPANGLISNYYWSGSLTYSFPTTSVSYESGYAEATHDFAAVTDAQRQAVRYILEGFSPVPGGPEFHYGSYESLILTSISEAASPGSGVDPADIRIAQTSDANPTAYAYYPAPGDVHAGDVWFGDSYDYGNPILGTYEWFTHIHELGHSFGLKHGHETSPNGALPADRDGVEFSVMTYRSYVGGPTDYITVEEFGLPQTLMMYDIAALQYLYGADFATNSGDTVYTWNSTTGEMSLNGVGQGAPGGNRILLTVWDGGGTDTYDLSNYGGGVSIDLRPGFWSIASQAQRSDLDAFNPGAHLANGNIYNALLYNNDARSYIENATGGGGNDVLTGNDVANVLRGNAGADTLYGGAGNDSLVGGAGIDTMFGGTGNDSYTIDDVGDIADETGGSGFDTVSVLVSGITVSVGIERIDVGVGSGLTITAGGTTDNTMVGANGADRLIAGDGRDLILGNAGNDILEGGNGNDTLYAGTNDDTLYGGSGNDVLYGEAGTNTYFGGDNDDEYRIDSAGDISDETGFSGADKAYVSVSGVTVGAGIERIEITAAAGGTVTAAGTTDNTMVGGSAADVLYAGAGNDLLYGGGGADTYYGGTGNDTYRFDDAGDVADETGGSGFDQAQIYASGATVGQDVERIDVMITGNVTVTAGGTTDNTMVGGAGNDRLSAGDGRDLLVGNGGNDILEAGNGNDTVFAGMGNDTLYGGSGNDVLYGEGGTDTLYGGDGDDEYRFDDAFDTADETGGSGFDKAYILATGATVGPGIERIEALALTGITATAIGNTDNTVVSNAGGDHMLAGDGKDLLVGNGGNDILEGGNGNDTFYAGTGDDTLYGGAGNDLMYGESGTDTLFGGAGDDDYRLDSVGDVADETGGSGFDRAYVYISGLTVGAGVERIDISVAGGGTVTATGATDNTIVGSGSADVIYAGAGNDVLYGGGGYDTYYGGDGNDTYRLDDSGDFADETTGSGFDQAQVFASGVTVGVGIERIDVSIGGNVTVTALGTTDNTIVGAGGNDHLIAGDGRDLVIGNAGNDILEGGAGNDTLYAGTNDDTLYGGSGNDLMYGEAGTNTFFGGDGDDDYRIDGGGDVSDETGCTGADRAFVSVSGVTVGQGIERIDVTAVAGATVTAAGTTDNTIFGSASLDVIFAGAGNDSVSGNAGADTLAGGLGNDVLTGGADADIFAYAIGDGDDRIADFGAVQGDKVDLTGVSFDHLGANGNIAVLSDGHTITAQTGFIWSGGDFI